MIVNVLDASDLDRPGRRKAMREEQEYLRNWIMTVRLNGGNLIEIRSMSNAIGHMVSRVIDMVGFPGRLSLLRFYGHGAPGVQGLAGGMWRDMTRHLSDVGLPRRRLAGRTLGDLRPYFATGGRVELHGCGVGRGPRGRRLLTWLSRTLGVPVTAGVRAQYDTAADWSFYKFEGPVRSAFPDGSIRRTAWYSVPGGGVCSY